MPENQRSQLPTCPSTKTPQHSTSTKAKLINAIFLPTLTYQCQTWSLTKDLERKLVTCEMKCLRKAANKTRRDQIRISRAAAGVPIFKLPLQLDRGNGERGRGGGGGGVIQVSAALEADALGESEPSRGTSRSDHGPWSGPHSGRRQCQITHFFVPNGHSLLPQPPRWTSGQGVRLKSGRSGF